LQLLVSGIGLGAIYALVALGFVTIYRTSKVVNMAQGSFVMLGTMFAYSFLNELGWPFWASAIVSIIGVIVLGVLIFQVILKPMLKAPPAAMILLTIAISVLIEGLALLKWGGYGLGLPAFTGEKSLWLGGVAIPPQVLWVLGITIAVLLFLYYLNNRTLIGKQMTATATRPNAASLCGISTTTMIIIAFAISAGIGAIGGVSFGSLVPIAFTTGGLIGLNGFVAAILGGWGSSSGAVVGGFTLGILEALFTGIVPAGYKDALAFVLLIIVVYFRPSGLLGTPQVEGEE
jgi:branched-chain amino acid transport system permease protein